MDIDERHESIRKEQFEKIKAGNSVFGLVPSEIGEITFCDSTEWGEKAPTSAEANKFRVWTLVVVVGIIAFFWLVFPNATVLNIIVTIAVSLLGVLLIATAGDFTGTDYFIGNDGFAVMKFKNSRSNFVEKHIVKFSDVSDLVDYDIEHYDSKGKYFQSLYSFSFHSVFGKEELKNIQGVGEGKVRQPYAKEFVDLIKRYCEENEIERQADMRVRTVAKKSILKVKIIQAIDRQIALDDIATAQGLEFEELLDEVEAIVYSGTKLNIDYFLDEVMDEDHVDDIYDYFADSESDSLEDAINELGGECTEDEIRLVRIKFISDMAN